MCTLIVFYINIMQGKVTFCTVVIFIAKSYFHLVFRAAIQRQGSILAWIVILSVYGADTIATDLSLSALIL
jgi:hypothetical protein